MKVRQLILCLCLVLALTLLACQRQGSPTELPTATSSAATATPVSGGDADETPSTSVQKAPIDSIDILILESFPVQVNVVARGTLPDGCEEIGEIDTRKELNTFYIEITAETTGTVCTQALAPFEETISLDVEGLPAGTYTVDVNGVRDTFRLDVPNVLPDSETAPQPEAWKPAEYPEAGIRFQVPDAWSILPATATLDDVTEWSPDGNPVPHIGFRWAATGPDWSPDAMLSVTARVISRGTFDLGWATGIDYLVHTPDETVVERHIIVPNGEVLAYDFYAVAESEAALESLAPVLESLARTGELTPLADEVPPPAGTSSIGGVVWDDTCVFDANGAPTENCVVDGPASSRGDGALGEGESALQGVQVTLLAGLCPGGQVVATATTDTAGRYTFDELGAGTYCVRVDAESDPNAAILDTGGWTYPNIEVGYITVDLGEGETRSAVNFGWDYQLL